MMKKVRIMAVQKDINGVEYTYANKDEIAFGTFEEEDVPEQDDTFREQEIKREEAFDRHHSLR